MKSATAWTLEAGREPAKRTIVALLTPEASQRVAGGRRSDHWNTKPHEIRTLAAVPETRSTQPARNRLTQRRCDHGIGAIVKEI
jgi:hypothetical protein